MAEQERVEPLLGDAAHLHQDLAQAQLVRAVVAEGVDELAALEVQVHDLVGAGQDEDAGLLLRAQHADEVRQVHRVAVAAEPLTALGQGDEVLRLVGGLVRAGAAAELAREALERARQPALGAAGGLPLGRSERLTGELQVLNRPRGVGAELLGAVPAASPALAVGELLQLHLELTVRCFEGLEGLVVALLGHGRGR